MSLLGISSLSAEIIDVENKGDKKVIQVSSRGLTERAAIRGAKSEATGIIPLRSQDVIRIIKDGEHGMVQKRYLITIAEK